MTLREAPTRIALTAALALLLAAVTAMPAMAQVNGAPPLEVLYGFTLIDGRGGPPIPDAAMAIRGNEILAVSTRRQLLSEPDAPRDAIVTDLGGGWVIPGLIDNHVHLSTSPNRSRAEAELERLLYGGVVAVRDMAGDARALASLARDTRLGQIRGPDVYFSALMAGPSFLSDPRPQASAAGETAGEVPWMQAITPETDLVAAVAMAKGTYATGIKIYANLEPDVVGAITREAHRQGMLVWAHSMVFPTRPMDVVGAGVDVISHVCRLAWEGMAEAPAEYHHDEVPRYGNFSAESAVFTELFESMRANGTVLDATLAMYARAAADGDNQLSDRCDVDFARALVARATELDVPVVAGTDFTTPQAEPFPALYDEMEELATGGGLTPMEAILSATSVAAAAIGAEDRYGVLEQGRPVSFVLLADDPLADMSSLRSVRAVWKNGERFDRTSYRPRVADAVGEEEPTSGPASPQEALQYWLGLWRRYDTDDLADVFLVDPAMTYFPSDSVGLVEGFEALVEYHRTQGFVSGGLRPDQELWLEDTVITDFDESAVVSAVWHYGNRVSRAGVARGPLTLVVTRTSNGYRISHVNMGNYPGGS
ncbi:MAG: amidohydrolase family protein [Gemmatimonadetes bacterium]|nr:amidohydrolase family protein [Gemmatimonadota bacterium]NNL29892.1 amidohydrolase family protein [Gemmatimonadota bacterium]